MSHDGTTCCSSPSPSGWRATTAEEPRWITHTSRDFVCGTYTSGFAARAASDSIPAPAAAYTLCGSVTAGMPGSTSTPAAGGAETGGAETGEDGEDGEDAAADEGGPLQATASNKAAAAARRATAGPINTGLLSGEQSSGRNGGQAPAREVVEKPGKRLGRPGMSQVQTDDAARGHPAHDAPDRGRSRVGEVPGVDIVGEHPRIAGRRGGAQDHGGGVLRLGGTEERSGAAGRRGDPVTAPLNLGPDRRLVERRKVRVRPSVVTQLVTEVGDEPSRVRILLQPRSHGQHGHRGAPVVQQGQHPAREVEIAGAVEGQR